MKRVIAPIAALGLVLTMAAAPHPPDGPWLARRLAQTATGAGAFADLQAFQRIADRNSGIRSAGTPGFAASAQYVTGRLKAAGYRVRSQTVPYQDYQVDAEQGQETAPQARQIRTLVMSGSPVTPAGGFTAPLLVVPANAAGTQGCSAADYTDLPVQGAIVLLPRGSCGYTAQQRVIAAAGGRAMLLYLSTPSPENIWRLHVFTSTDFTIPAASVSQSQAELLAADAARHGVRVHLDLRGHQVDRTTVNLFAETRGGSAARVVMAGAHLDSVTEGPGIDDNVSSGAALLEIARKLAPYQDQVRNKVRFVWWGAEEVIDVGSDYYVAGLSTAERARIALYLNFELIGAPNFVRFLMDDSTPAPPGSGVVSQAFQTYFTRVGLPFETESPYAIGSDHEPFMTAGIPVGGIDGGTLGVKTAAEATTFGGQAGQLYDHCYHQACDTIGNINRPFLDQNVPAIAWVVGRFATDVTDVEVQRAGG